MEPKLLKLKIFSNIPREIPTPLILIKGIAGEIGDEHKGEEFT